MANDSPRPVLNVAAGDAKLGRILRKAQRLKALETQLARLLPPALAGQARVADLRDGVLVLGAPSPAAAAQLRYAGADILKGLPPDFRSDVRRVVVRVVQPAGPPAPGGPAPSPHRDPPEALERAARAVSDPELRAVLERMAKRARDARGGKEEG